MVRKSPVRRVLLKVALVLAAILGAGSLATFLWLERVVPPDNDSVVHPSLSAPVDVLFDAYGVPHIDAKSEADAYFALGYVQARDRLFQMELTRRVASGRLSEILGADFVRIDAFFRTLGLGRHAEESAALYLSSDSLPYQRAALAYLNGINAFIDEGVLPVEFTLMDISVSKFTATDLYLTSEYLAFNFSMAVRTDPVMSYIRYRMGEPYYRDLAHATVPGSLTIPVGNRSVSLSGQSIDWSLASELSKIPVPPLKGSNGWVVSPKRSASGKVLLGNDTHIGFGQPSVWYEANLRYPGFNLYGLYLAGFPFAAIGHDAGKAWGLTMMENDDMDFYSEEVFPADSSRYMVGNTSMLFDSREEVIRVKDSSDIRLLVRETARGPLVQDVMPEWKAVTNKPVSVFWTQLKFPSNLLQVTHRMGKSQNMAEFESAVSEIISPGINVLYGDSSGHIAWWAAAKLLKRNPGVDPVILQDASDTNTHPLGFLPFTENPFNVDPEVGIVYNANNQPSASPGSELYPGYYTPEDRALRIRELETSVSKIGIGESVAWQNDHRSPVTPRVAGVVLDALPKSFLDATEARKKFTSILRTWDGSHGLNDKAPVLYYKLLYHIFHGALSDEMGDEHFARFLSTHVVKVSTLPLVLNDSSAWWNDVRTDEVFESRLTVFEQAVDKTLQELYAQLGPDMETWTWSRVHLLEHKHPVGEQAPLNHLFNVGPFPAPGGPEVLCQMGFDLNETGVYRTKYGAAMRTTIDFSKPFHALNVLPTGQSAHVNSAHYDDQAILYNTGRRRVQRMIWSEVEAESKARLRFLPAVQRK
jgi:penicillin amidase